MVIVSTSGTTRSNKPYSICIEDNNHEEAALGTEKAKAFPAFHAFSGADITGKFANIGKTTWFEIFLKTTTDVINALTLLSTASEVTDGIQSAIAKFVCAAYCPKGIQIFKIPELRWYLFCKHMAESVKLPPTIGALKQHILRVHLQASVWGQASIAQQIFLDSLQNGYHRNSDRELTPTTTDILPSTQGSHRDGEMSVQGRLYITKVFMQKQQLTMY